MFAERTIFAFPSTRNNQSQKDLFSSNICEYQLIMLVWCEAFFDFCHSRNYFNRPTLDICCIFGGTLTCTRLASNIFTQNKPIIISTFYYLEWRSKFYDFAGSRVYIITSSNLTLVWCSGMIPILQIPIRKYLNEYHNYIPYLGFFAYCFIIS